MSLGVPELVVILIIVLLLFGPSKLPGLGKSVGEAIRGFKKGLNEDAGVDQQKEKLQSQKAKESESNKV